MSRTDGKGETARSSFRLPADVLAKLDELVKAFEAEAGRPENKTTVLIQLINREHARRSKRKRGAQ